LNSDCASAALVVPIVVFAIRVNCVAISGHPVDINPDWFIVQPLVFCHPLNFQFIPIIEHILVSNYVVTTRIQTIALAVCN
jgi:hypothetical protein